MIANDQDSRAYAGMFSHPQYGTRAAVGTGLVLTADYSGWSRVAEPILVERAEALNALTLLGATYEKKTEAKGVGHDQHAHHFGVPINAASAIHRWFTSQPRH